MRFIAFILLILVSLESWATAPSKSDTTKVKLGSKNSVGVGVRFVSGLKNLNENLSSIEYPEIALTPVLYNFGIALSRGKGSFGSTYNFLIYPESKSGNLISTGFGFGSELRYTRNFVQRDKVSIYPILGFGAQFNKFRNNFTNELTFNNAVNNPQVDPLGRTEPVRINGTEFFSSLGLGYEKIFNLDKKTNTGYSAGIQAAYSFGLYNSWAVDQQMVSTNANTGGFEVRLIFSGIRFPVKR